jgi:hypothetical protein
VALRHWQRTGGADQLVGGVHALLYFPNFAAEDRRYRARYPFAVEIAGVCRAGARLLGEHAEFVGLNLDDAVWHPTVYSKNRHRLLVAEVAREFFDGEVTEATHLGLMSDEHLARSTTLCRHQRFLERVSFSPFDYEQQYNSTSRLGQCGIRPTWDCHIPPHPESHAASLVLDRLAAEWST